MVEVDGETVYLSTQVNTWDHSRPNYLDENDEPFLSVEDKEAVAEEALEIVTRETVVDVTPSWMGFDEDPIDYGQYRARFTLLTFFKWCGFFLSLPLYVVLFKRSQMEVPDWILSLFGLVLFSFVPILTFLKPLPYVYYGIFLAPLISMLVLWRTTRERPVQSEVITD